MIQRELETVVRLVMSEEDLNSIVNLLVDLKGDASNATPEYRNRLDEALNGLRGLNT